MSKDFYTASELADLGYVSERLTSVFGEPDSAGGELRWDGRHHCCRRAGRTRSSSRSPRNT